MFRAQRPVADDGSPLVIRSTAYDPARHRVHLERELGPVIEIMQNLGLPAVGFAVTGEKEIELNRLCRQPEAIVEKLELACGKIRAEAEKTIGELALPNAMIVYQGHGRTLFGDKRTGEFWESGVSLVSARPGDTP